MRKVLFLALTVGLVSGCCCSRYRDTALYTREGKAKPIVAVLPVLNHCQETPGKGVNWDIGRELTEEVRRRIFDSSRVYLLRERGDSELAEMLNKKDPEALTHLALENTGGAEFVVVTELVHHEELPCTTPRMQEHINHVGDVASILSMDFRVRVLDVRGAHPRIILQEIVHNEHFIPRPYLSCDYAKSPWGSDSYNCTPMGMAHSKLIREVAARIESHIQAVR